MDAQQSETNTLSEIASALPENFESLENVDKLEILLESAMKILKLEDQNLILVNGDLSLGEFLGNAFRNQKIYDLLQQDG